MAGTELICPDRHTVGAAGGAGEAHGPRFSTSRNTCVKTVLWRDQLRRFPISARVSRAGSIPRSTVQPLDSCPKSALANGKLCGPDEQVCHLRVRSGGGRSEMDRRSSNAASRASWARLNTSRPWFAGVPATCVPSNAARNPSQGPYPRSDPNCLDRPTEDTQFRRWCESFAGR